ncbi:hypothetical protein BJ508DRAFT_303247 [Ascobolus immersus RN42]|uniref:Uncharacterized protein n=1 Tax=Ascobolus immersus RN42 TaxID=1160509 RepID=A0A3N4IM00_ASCIM|nr:hypothetical protein BJ508DRAFT_303247 [Ascobolus immersus RN42]
MSTPHGSEPDTDITSLSPSGSRTGSVTSSARTPGGTKASTVKTRMDATNIASFVDISQRSPTASPTLRGWEGYPGLGLGGSGPGSVGSLGSGKSPFTPLKRVKKQSASGTSEMSARGSVSGGDKTEDGPGPKLVMLHVDLIPPPKEGRHSHLKHPFSTLSPILFSRGILLQHPHSSFTRLHADIRSSLGLTLPTLSTRVLSKTTLPEEEEGVIIVEKKVRVRGWEVNVYAANGLMTQGAWERVWEQMERVDVEVVVGEWVEVRREVRHVGDPEVSDEEEDGEEEWESGAETDDEGRGGRGRESTPVPYPMTDDDDDDLPIPEAGSRPVTPDLRQRQPSVEDEPMEPSPRPIKPALRKPKEQRPRSPSPVRRVPLKTRIRESKVYLRTVDFWLDQVRPRVRRVAEMDNKMKILVALVVVLLAVQIQQIFFARSVLPGVYYGDEGPIPLAGCPPGYGGGVEGDGTTWDVLAPTGEPEVGEVGEGVHTMVEGEGRRVIRKLRKRRVKKVVADGDVPEAEASQTGESEAKETGEGEEETVPAGEHADGVDPATETEVKPEDAVETGDVVKSAEEVKEDEEEEEEDLPKRVLWKIIGE